MGHQDSMARVVAVVAVERTTVKLGTVDKATVPLVVVVIAMGAQALTVVEVVGLHFPATRVAHQTMVVVVATEQARGSRLASTPMALVGTEIAVVVVAQQVAVVVELPLRRTSLQVHWSGSVLPTSRL